MLGCESCAAICASRTKRVRTFSLYASSGGSTLMATWRPSFRSVARKTTADPPRPISPSTRYCVPMATTTRSSRLSFTDSGRPGGSLGQAADFISGRQYVVDALRERHRLHREGGDVLDILVTDD